MPDDVITAPDGGEAAAAAADAAQVKSDAQRMADIVAAGMKREGLDQPPPVEDPNAVQAAGTETTEEVVEEPITAEELTEVEGVLAELGIDLGINSADVPEALRPAYERLIDSAVSVAEDALRRQLEASASTREIEQFKESVEKSPDRLLLSLAMKHPDLITKAAELVGQMQADPRVKEQVIHEVEVELKLQEADRKSRMLDEREARIKASQVIAATRRAARDTGIPYNMAESYIAAMVKANGGSLKPEDVPGLLEELKPKKPVVKQKVVNPAVLAAAKAAPAGAVAGSQAVTPTNTISPGLKDGERKHSGGGFRALVREAMKRTANIGSGS
jgi:hypothetical protein